jgi:hypothetical protein
MRAGWLLLIGVGACAQRVSTLQRPVPINADVVDKLVAHRIAGNSEAQVVRLSLPLPRGMEDPLVLRGRPTQVQPVGFWPEEQGRRAARRAILFACGRASDNLPLAHGEPARGEFTGPRAEVRVLDKRYETLMPWEVGELVLTNDAGTLGLRVGLQLDDGQCHWWQWVTTEVLEEGPVCRTIRAKGAIPVYWERHESEEAQATGKGDWAVYPWFHRHNHVRGEIVARCYTNGVVELFIRHLNGRFFTEGGVLKGVVPVIGFRGEGGNWPEKPEPVTGRRRWRWDGVAVDTAGAATLVSEEHPGKAWQQDGVFVYQPYEGAEPMAGGNAEQRTGDAYITRADRHEIPKGMGRTIRMVASLGPAEPEVAVYLLPDWWYGLSEDLSESALLPVRDYTFVTIQKAINHYRDNHFEGCFDDGAVPRVRYPGEPGWEGEVPQAQLVAAYLTGKSVDYDLALRSAYHVADVAVDKALFAVRMHGYAPPAQSLPMQRTLGLVAAYMENGDPYLLDTAQSVSETAYWWDRHNWPRRSYGRDAAYIRSLVYLYRYLGEPHYLDRAQEALHRLVSCQLGDGSFADQGDTTGVHAAMNLIVKPWMGCIATEAMVDFLHFREDDVVAEGALRYCQWLLSCRVKDDRGKHWVYQVSHAGEKYTYRLDGTRLPLGEGRWHVEYLAKLMLWAAMRTGDPAYYEAWREAYLPQAESPELWDHAANKIVTNLSAQRQELWRARLTSKAITLDPQTDLAVDLEAAVISTPDGLVRIRAAGAHAREE